LVLTGCNVLEKDEPIWEHVKIGDIAPSHSGKRPGAQLLEIINFDVYIFEIPVENINALDDVRQMLHTNPLQFNDYDAFSANSFSVGFGQVGMWNEIRELLRVAGGKRVETVSLLLPDGQAETITIARLDSEQSIFYISSEGSMEGATIGPGELALWIRAEKVPGSRGVCKMSALPVFSPMRRSSISQLTARAKSDELPFTCCGFELKMSPGDFVFLAPEKYIGNQITLASYFFSRPKPRSVVRTYLIVCAEIVNSG